MKFKDFSLEFGKAIIPQKIRSGLDEYFQKAGYINVKYEYFAYLFYTVIFLTIILYSKLFTLLVGKTSAIKLAIGTLLFILICMFILIGVFALGVFIFIDVRIYRRTKELEEILPQFLESVSSNLKGGMSFDQALWKSISPRYGILAYEIELAAKKVMVGEDIEPALLELSRKYKSVILHRSLTLVVEGIKSGGEIVSLLDKVIESIYESRNLKKEMVASISSYKIFITIIVLGVAPALFALSFQLLKIITALSSQIGDSVKGVSTSLPISFGSVSISLVQFERFAMINLALISLFSAMILSLINEGDIKGGLKYIPIFILVSVGVFLVFSLVLGKLFGGLFLA